MNKNRLILNFAFFTILLIFVLSITFSLFGQDTTNDLVKFIKNRYSNIKDYQGNIILQQGDKGALQNGEMLYKYPGKFKVTINTPEKKIYVSDGKTLFIYYPALSIVATQQLRGKASLPYGQSKETVDYLFDAYTFNFTEGKALYTFNNFKVYKLKGWPKRYEAGFKSLEIYVDDTGFIVYQSAVTLEGKVVRYYFTSYKTNVDLSNLLFNFDMPDNVQVLENIFE